MGRSNFPSRRLGRTGWPATKADQFVAPGGNSISRNCRPLFRTDSDISVIIWPSSATTLVNCALSTSACKHLRLVKSPHLERQVCNPAAHNDTPARSPCRGCRPNRENRPCPRAANPPRSIRSPATASALRDRDGQQAGFAFHTFRGHPGDFHRVRFRRTRLVPGDRERCRIRASGFAIPRARRFPSCSRLRMFGPEISTFLNSRRDSHAQFLHRRVGNVITHQRASVDERFGEA